MYEHVCIKQTHAVNSIEFLYSSDSRPAVSGTPHRQTKLYFSIVGRPLSADGQKPYSSTKCI